MIRAIVNGNGAFYQKLFLHLQDEFDWKICAWLVDDGCVPVAGRLFPEAHIFNMPALNAGIVPDGFDYASLPPLNEQLLEDIQWCEPVVYEMMGRIGSNQRFGYEDRRRLYHFLIRYWLFFIDAIKAEVFFAPYAPHEVCDFVLFVLCRHLKIPTMMFEWTSLPGRRFLIDDYRSMPVMPVDSENRNLSESLSEAAEEELSRLRRDYQQAMPGYFLASQGERNIVRSNVVEKSIARFGRVLRRLRALPSAMKRSKNPFARLYYRGPLPAQLEPRSATRFEDALHAAGIRERFRLSKEIYSSLCVQPDLNVPYIYLALHFQPERSTCPAGGIFSDQRLVVSLLANSMPAGWILYVKEHPSQFAESRYGYLSRSPEFYLDIAAHGNVRFIAQHTPQFELIDNSKAVATITGTSGWEALVRGRPALVFGDSWYQGSPGAYRIRSHADCKDAIDRILASPLVVDAQIRAFVAWVERVALPVYLGEEEALWDKTNYNEESNIHYCAAEMSKFLHEQRLAAGL